MKPLRTALFAPGSKDRVMAKALESGADAVIFDLEDAVSPERRPEARNAVAEYLLKTTQRAVPFWVRINPAFDDDALEDLTSIAGARPDGIVLPKARHADDLHRLDHWLEALEVEHGEPRGGIKVVALVTETAGGVLNAASFAQPPARVAGYTWGAEDLATEVGALGNRTAEGEFEFTFKVARAACLMMAAAAGVAALDTIDAEFRDLAAVERRARASRRDGFVGKLLIHPAQVAPIHAAFSASAEEIEWARRVVAAFSSASGQGAVSLDGRMLDRPHLTQAKRLLAAQASR